MVAMVAVTEPPTFGRWRAWPLSPELRIPPVFSLAHTETVAETAKNKITRG